MNIFKNVGKFSTVPLSIKTTQLPLCINCKFFIEKKNNYLHSSFSDDNYGRCKKFGSIDLFTGSIEYKFASSCREYDHIKTIGVDGKLYHCGREGLLFEQK